jgi:phosphotransferase system IIA component
MGEGYSPKVNQGQTVRKGQLLASFNLQKRQEQNQHNPYQGVILVTNAELLGPIYYANDNVTAGEDILLTITAKSKSTDNK